jgi:hypothetical protein
MKMEGDVQRGSNFWYVGRVQWKSYFLQDMNAKSFFIATLLIATLLSGCSDDNYPSVRSCVNKVLKDNGLEPYTNQEIGCRSFVTLHALPGKQYFLWNNHCAGMITYPFDCDGRSLCEDPQSDSCIDFYRNADYVGIVGIAAN